MDQNCQVTKMATWSDRKLLTIK